MKKFTFLAVALLLNLSSFAQQALFDNAPVISPEVNANHTVTFRLKAPNAQKVQVRTCVVQTNRADCNSPSAPAWYAPSANMEK